MSAGERWRTSLEAWTIPEAILTQAEENPWILPAALFQIPAVTSTSPSHERTRGASC